MRFASSPLGDTEGTGGPARLAAGPTTRRILALGALVLAEWLFLGMRFETPNLGPEWWAVVLRRASGIMPLGAAVVTAALLLGGARLRSEGWQAALPGKSARRAAPFLLAHFVALAVFFEITAFVLEGGFRASPQRVWWAAAWVASGLTTAGLLAASAVPLGVLVRLAGSWWSVVAGCLAVGASALAVGRLTGAGWTPLGSLTLQLVGRIVALVVSDPVVEPASFVVGTGRFAVTIEWECSGYQGIGLIWVFLGAYLWAFRGVLRFPRALWLLPIGTVVVWVLNAVRIAGLILIGTWISPAVALGGFHSYSGSLFFCAVALGLAAFARRSRLFAVDADGASGDALVNPVAPYLVPFLTLVATAMVTGALAAGTFDAFYPLRVVAVGATLQAFRRRSSGLAWSWSWPAVTVGVLVCAAWIALQPASSGAATSAEIAAGLAALPPAWASVWLGARVIGAVVTVPLAEELAFRGYLLRRLVAADFERVPAHGASPLALVLSSLAFGALHQQLLAGTVAGLAYGLVFSRRGALGDAVLAHATTNALLVGYVLTTGAWSLLS